MDRRARFSTRPARSSAPAAAVITGSYLLGAIPFSNYAAGIARGVDLRDVGTGTVSGTAVYRAAGFTPMAVAGVVDIAKATVGPILAGDRRRLAAVAAGAAVCGHNWSPFLGGAGGRGISPALGALVVHNWPGTATLAVGLAAGRLARHTGLGTLLAVLALTPVLGATRGRSGALAGVAVAVPVLVKRVLGNRLPPHPRSRGVWRNRLLYDRDTADPDRGSAA